MQKNLVVEHEGDTSHICNMHAIASCNMHAIACNMHAIASTCMPYAIASTCNMHAIASCHHVMSHTQMNALDLNESCRRRWVASFQQTLRMLWEAHAHRSAEGSDGTGTSRSARQGVGGAVESMGNVDRASRCHLVVADTVPPFLESPPSSL